LPKFKKRRICLRAGRDPLYLKGPTPQNETGFYRGLLERLKTPGVAKEILVMVHGYDFNFDEAVLWAAQLKNDSKFAGVQVLYSWPSRGRRRSYFTDTVSAEWSRPKLKKLLEDLFTHADGAKIHIIAHSLGNYPLVRALNDMVSEHRTTPLPQLGQIILAAPDVDSGIFTQLMLPVLNRRLAERVTLYSSTKDKALGITWWLFNYPRAGRSEKRGPVYLSGSDTIDVTDVDNSRGRHCYFLQTQAVLEDIGNVLTGASIKQRQQLQTKCRGGYRYCFSRHDHPN